MYTHNNDGSAFCAILSLTINHSYSPNLSLQVEQEPGDAASWKLMGRAVRNVDEGEEINITYIALRILTLTSCELRVVLFHRYLQVWMRISCMLSAARCGGRVVGGVSKDALKCATVCSVDTADGQPPCQGPLLLPEIRLGGTTTVQTESHEHVTCACCSTMHKVHVLLKQECQSASDKLFQASVLQHIVTPRNTPQHTATHCTTLHHTHVQSSCFKTLWPSEKREGFMRNEQVCANFWKRHPRRNDCIRSSTLCIVRTAPRASIVRTATCSRWPDNILLVRTCC